MRVCASTPDTGTQYTAVQELAKEKRQIQDAIQMGANVKCTAWITHTALQWRVNDPGLLLRTGGQIEILFCTIHIFRLLSVLQAKTVNNLDVLTQCSQSIYKACKEGTCVYE